MTALDGALAATARGWHVFPVKASDKRPATANGQNDASADPQRIRQWLAAGPHLNYGVHCAPSGLYVVDIDPRHGGEDTWRALVAEHGEPARTFTVRTPSGGRHLYFRMPAEPLANTAGRPGVGLGPGIDTRGNGYVVGPGSVIDGVPYEVLDGGEVAELPAWIESLARSRRPVVEAPSGPLASSVEVLARVQQWADEIAHAPEGAGNDTASQAAFFVGQYVGAGQVAFEVAEAMLTSALAGWTYTRGGEGDMRATIRRGLADGTAEPRPWTATQGVAQLVPLQAAPSEPQEAPDALLARWVVDLKPFLDGTFLAPSPSLGIVREDGRHVLYPGKWHTLIGPTASGKSWFAAQCVFDELCAGRTVVYVHFEESLPAGTVGRLRDLGLSVDTILSRFLWIDTQRRISGAELAAIAETVGPSLVILDGINAACSAYGWPVNDTIAVGSYRNTLVAPFVAHGAAVLSLGHPPKAKDRQGERHGFGSTAWLDEVDGVGFRITPSKSQPIGRGKVGYSNLATVKDRYGQVEALGELSDTEGWYEIGSLRVDSDPEQTPAVRVRMLQVGETSPGRDKVDGICDEVVDHLEARGAGFTSIGSLRTTLGANGLKVRAEDLLAALERLRQRGRLDWPETGPGKPRPGRLASVVELAPTHSGRPAA